MGERTCVCQQFIFAASMTKQSPCGTIGRRPPMMRDRLGGGQQPVRGLTVPHRFFRVHFDASRGFGPITAPLSYLSDHSARWRNGEEPRSERRASLAPTSPPPPPPPQTPQQLPSCHLIKDRLLRPPSCPGMPSCQLTSALPGSGGRCCSDDSELQGPKQPGSLFLAVRERCPLLPLHGGDELPRSTVARPFLPWYTDFTAAWPSWKVDGS